MTKHEIIPMQTSTQIAFDLYKELVGGIVLQATLEERRVDRRFYERLHFNCSEAVMRFAQQEGAEGESEGALNVAWDKINSRCRG